MRNEQCKTKAPCRKNCPILNQFSSIERRFRTVPFSKAQPEIERVVSIDARRLKCPPVSINIAQDKIFSRTA